MKTVKAKKVSAESLHFEHERWTKQLDFYKDELKIYKNRLEEIAIRYTDNNVLAKLEQFQNQFILQNEVVDVLIHDIHSHEGILVNEIKNTPIAVKQNVFNNHDGLRDRVEAFVKLYNELKYKYMRYLSKYI